jgi:hypothetical protein
MDRNEVLLKELSRILKDAMIRNLPKRLRLSVDRDLLETLYLWADTAMVAALSRIPEVIEKTYYYVDQYESERDFFCEELATKNNIPVQQIKTTVNDFVDEVGDFLYQFIVAYRKVDTQGRIRGHRVKERT